MKIERISENQLKLTLTKDDLVERDIKLEDLIQPSEKTQRLFHDIMEQALDETDFIEENAPLMVEAMPMGLDGITIIVTKVSKEKGKRDSSELLSRPSDSHRWKKKPLDTLERSAEEASDLLIYSFAELDDVISLSVQLAAQFQGESALYKNEGRYFLILQKDGYAAETAQDPEWLLREYGQKHISSPLAKYYLLEHGEAIIPEQAVKALAKTFG